ncbi:MAG: PAS domain-containing protein [Phycisphaerales bacterium]|nr:PAS domain-containing protein [Phycisphaerales bacterium]
MGRHHFKNDAPPKRRIATFGIARVPWRPSAVLRTLPLLVLILGTGLSILASHAVTRSETSESRTRFERETARLKTEITRRFARTENALHEVRSAYAASGPIRRGEFQRLVASMDLEREFPGATSLGLIERVARDGADSFASGERADDGEGFAVRSDGSDPMLYVIKFIEPRQANRASWGYDVGSVCSQCEAIKRAIDTGGLIITGRGQLTPGSLPRGVFTYYLPVYRSGAAASTVEDRRDALLGVLFAPVALEDAVAGATDAAGTDLDFRIVDEGRADGSSDDAVLHGTSPVVARATNEPGFAQRTFHASTAFDLGGRTWRLVTSTTPPFEAAASSGEPTIILLAGLSLSAMTAALLTALRNSQIDALTRARQMTADLKHLALVAQKTTNAVVVTDAEGAVTWVNEGFTRLTGYELKEVLGRRPGSVLQCEQTDPAAVETMRQAIRAGRCCRVEIVNRKKSGELHTVQLEIQPIHNEAGQLTSFVALQTDVTEIVEQRESLRAAKELAEEALCETRALRATIDEHAIVSVADASGRIVDVNPAFCKISGYTKEELIGHNHRIVNSGVHPKEFWVEMWRTIAAGRPWRGEVCNRAKDGSLYWVDSMIAPFHDVDGRMVKYVSIRTDITARKRAEEESRTSSEMLRRTGAMARVGGWELDVETMTPTWSEEVYAIHEVTPGDSVEMTNALAAYPNDANTQINEAIRNAIQCQTPFDLVLPFVTAKGKHLWVRAQGEPVVEGGRVTRLVGALQDVTLEVSQTIAAREQADRLQLTVRAAGLGTWEWNCVSGEVAFNETWCTMLGYQPGDIAQDVSAWKQLVHPDDWDRVMSVLTAHLEGRTREYRCEHRLRRKNGTWAWILDVGQVTARDDEGKPLRAAGVHVDIDSAKKLEESLSEAKQIAEAATRAKSEFLANMSHEIRTPLTAILGYADLLREEGEVALSPERRMEMVDTIRGAGQHLLTVINDILDLSKIEAGKMTVEKIETPLVQILHEVQSLIAPRARGKGVTMTTRFDTPVPERIKSDPTRLRQILMNLVGNAAKFTEEGNITMATRMEQGRLLIDIEDTGPGMTLEQASALFSAFSQADSTVSRKHGGTGLGLTICGRLAGLMDGSVTLVSTEVGAGSRFRLDLPMEGASGAPLVSSFDVVQCRNEKAAQATVSLRGRILLAEDGVDNQRLIAHHLRWAGATVEIAENGRRALEMLEAPGASFDLVLTDIQMPEMDGYTLARTLRERGNRIAIVALTAHAMAEDRQRCTDAGCDDYASKPIEKSALLDTCARWLGVSSAKAARSSRAA